MKEASGELNMTLVTVIAVGAILAFAMWFLPDMLADISNNWNNQGNIDTSEQGIENNN